MFHKMEPYAYTTEFKTYIPESIGKFPPILIENASRRKPFRIPKPQLSQLDFGYDIPGGSIVRVELRNGNVYEGTLFINPKYDMTHRTRIKIIKVVQVDSTNFHPLTPPISGILEFEVNEVDDVYVLKYETPKMHHTCEMIMETFVVETLPQFKNLIAALTSGGVNEVGFKLFGYNKGRFMELFWLVLCVRQTLVPIDMKGELNCPDVWMELKEKLFENESIVKIVHDVRYETDYLYHAVLSGIKLRNVYDTQLAIFFMDTRARYMERRRFAKKYPNKEPLKYSDLILNKLSLALTRYLSQTVWEREIILLFKFESEDWTRTTHFTQRPLPDPQALKYMALCVKYLSLLKHELMTDMMLCYDSCCQKLMHHMHAASNLEAAEIVEGPSTLPEKLLPGIEAYANSMNLERDRTFDPDMMAIVTEPPREDHNFDTHY